jgi:predicted MarR family transcription regulator
MSDLLHQWHKQKARRVAASPIEYAAAIECYRPASHGWKVALCVAAVLVLAAWSIKP